MTASGQPHLLFFNPDQWRGGALGHLGDRGAVTPRLDAFAREAVSFSQAYCQSPVCTPSRCSFMTGLYPHTRGHRSMHHLLHRDRGETNLLQALKAAGYFIFWAGKNDLIEGDDDFAQHCDVLYRPTPADFARWGLTPRPDIHQDQLSRRGQPGDDTYYSFMGGRLERGDEPVYANTDWPRIFAAQEFIRAYRGEQPLCVFLSLQYPHPPFLVEEPWFSAIDRAALPPRIPPPADPTQSPLMVQGLLRELGLSGWSEERWTELRATYYAMCSRVDHQFGLVCDALRERRIYDETAIFFFSDHGEYAGDYGLVEKAQNLFPDCLTRVPLLVRPPSGQACAPRVTDALVELVDFTATVCALSGAELGHHQFGRNLLPLLAGECDAGRAFVCCEGGRRPGEIEVSERESGPRDPVAAASGLYWPRMQLQQSEDPLYHGRAVMLRTATHKYVHRPYERDELYDLVADPTESSNRLDDPALASVLADLRRRLLDWLVETSDVVPRRADRRDPPHGIPAPPPA